ncbi:MAG: hypothetical protein KC900_13230 [Candidatus Omnitrophica bacterium]|nr:hypothetical protein [Candidatus Omnitrophota bacterium]
MNIRTISPVILFTVVVAAPAVAMPSAHPEPVQLQPDPGYGTRLAKFKKEQKRIVPDTMKRSSLHKIQQLREDKKKRAHYKKDDRRALDNRTPFGEPEEDSRFSRKGLSEEQIQYYMDRYRERKRLRAEYDRMSEKK